LYAGQAIENNMAHAQCMKDNQGYRHTVWTCTALLIAFAV